MLSEDYKKPSEDVKKAFYYFGFKLIVPYEDVNKKKKDLFREFQEDGEFQQKINIQFDVIKDYFDTPELKKDKTIILSDILKASERS